MSWLGVALRWANRRTMREELFEQFTLTLKGARRCAYDLKHAAEAIRDPEVGHVFEERACMWLEIFEPTGPKDYRHRLHRRIEDLQQDNRRLEDLCRANGINPTDPNSIPF